MVQVDHSGVSGIEGVLIQPLKTFRDERGMVCHMLRSDSPWFTRFGEIYFSFVNPGVVKAWKRHKKMTQNFAVPVGRIKLVLFDTRGGSNDKPILEEYELGQPEKYCLLRIPPMVWYGFQCLSSEPAMIANCSDLPHDPNESEGIEYSRAKIPFCWEKESGSEKQ